MLKSHMRKWKNYWPCMNYKVQFKYKMMSKSSKFRMIHNPWFQASWDSKEPSSHILKPLVHCTYMVAGENTVFPLSSLHSYPTNHCSIAVVLVISASMTGKIDRFSVCVTYLSKKYVPNKIVTNLFFELLKSIPNS